MKIIKRNGSEVPFDITKIITAVTKASDSVSGKSRLTREQITQIAAEVTDQCQSLNRAVSVEEIQDIVEDAIMATGAYEVARKYNKSVIIMEPVRGGSLAIMPPQVQEVFKKAEPEMSVASWAIRYAASLDGLVTVLSGMSTEEQLNDNVSYMENFQPLNEAERATVQQVVDILNSLPTIPCTACKYCVDGCPQKINIPGVFKAMNDLTLYNNKANAQRDYNNATKEGGKAGDCVQCGACEAHCPQKIQIIETLKKAAQTFA